jgi:putative ABC transport system substrate-binding protein
VNRHATIAALLALALVAGAGEVRAERVAIVLSADLQPYEEAAEGVEKLLGDHEVVTYSLEGFRDNWLKVEARLNREPADVVVTVGSLATALASRRMGDTPVVYTMVVNAEKLLDPNGAPATGVTLDQDPARSLGAMREALPRVRKVGVLYDPKQSGARVDEARVAAASLGLDLTAVEVEDTRDLPGALRRLLDQRPDALWLLVDRTVLSTQEGLELIMLETLRRGVPVVAPSERYTKTGALVAFSAEYGEVGEQAGRLTLRVLTLQEADAVLPLPAPERPERLKQVINEKVRETLGMEVHSIQAPGFPAAVP